MIHILKDGPVLSSQMLATTIVSIIIISLNSFYFSHQFLLYDRQCSKYFIFMNSVHAYNICGGHCYHAHFRVRTLRQCYSGFWALKMAFFIITLRLIHTIRSRSNLRELPRAGTGIWTSTFQLQV